MTGTRVKKQKLQGVYARDPVGANLLSRLLSKDPKLRPDPSRVLSHPFLTGGNRPVRMVGEDTQFDVFISYRVKSDKDAAEAIYDVLTEAGLKVWWDAKCLEKGKLWEAGFCDGMVSSAVFLPLLSKDAVNSDSVSWQNFSKLEKGSRCDNVFLEHRLALELKEMGLIEAVYPVFLGEVQTKGEGAIATAIKKDILGSEGKDDGDLDDKDQEVKVSDLNALRGSFSTRIYADFDEFKLPQLRDTEVDAVEDKLKGHLERQGLGLPLHEKATVNYVYSELSAYQGFFLKGPGAQALANLVKGVKEIVEKINSPKQSKTVSSQDTDMRGLRDENAHLKAEVTDLLGYQTRAEALIKRLGRAAAPHLVKK